MPNKKFHEHASEIANAALKVVYFHILTTTTTTITTTTTENKTFKHS